MNRSRAHVFVSGRVQGVFYRDSAKRKALELEVKGWIRNLPDGRVEGVFEGDEANVADLIDWCREGPPGAVVKGVDVRYEAPKGEFKGFDIVRW